jgi:CRP/FNR family transcriptional regulator, anaerobic regulatory protein
MFVQCAGCSLRQRSLFRPFSDIELQSIRGMKADHIAAAPGADIVREGEVGGPIYTLFEGWAVRYRHSPGGGRQILDILLPGDTIGLSAALLGMVDYSVQSVTAVTLCVLQAEGFGALIGRHPEIALGLLRTRMEEEQRADLRLLLLGRIKAARRIAYLMLDIFDRQHHRGMVNGGSTCPFPLRRRDLADAAGLSRVHVARTLDELRRGGLAAIQDGVLVLYDRQRLADFAGYAPPRMIAARAIL